MKYFENLTVTIVDGKTVISWDNNPKIRVHRLLPGETLRRLLQGRFGGGSLP